MTNLKTFRSDKFFRSHGAPEQQPWLRFPPIREALVGQLGAMVNKDF